MKKLSAVLVFTILVFFVGCSKDNDKDYFEAAQKAMDAKEYYQALVNYQKIVDEFPKSEHYQYALLQTGELTQGMVNKNISREEAFNKAINVYTEYQTKYPKDAKSPQALFMIGFIYANELGDTAKAKAAYSHFLELYPNSEMAESAKAEIENLGLTPDEILQKKISKK